MSFWDGFGVAPPPPRALPLLYPCKVLDMLKPFSFRASRRGQTRAQRPWPRDQGRFGKSSSEGHRNVWQSHREDTNGASVRKINPSRLIFLNEASPRQPETHERSKPNKCAHGASKGTTRTQTEDESQKYQPKWIVASERSRPEIT